MTTLELLVLLSRKDEGRGRSYLRRCFSCAVWKEQQRQRQVLSISLVKHVVELPRPTRHLRNRVFGCAVRMARCNVFCGGPDWSVAAAAEAAALGVLVERARALKVLPNFACRLLLCLLLLCHVTYHVYHVRFDKSLTTAVLRKCACLFVFFCFFTHFTGAYRQAR